MVYTGFVFYLGLRFPIYYLCLDLYLPGLVYVSKWCLRVDDVMRS